jgi:thiol-disulfide isomerase/thioredoxin
MPIIFRYFLVLIPYLLSIDTTGQLTETDSAFNLNQQQTVSKFLEQKKRFQTIRDSLYAVKSIHTSSINKRDSLQNLIRSKHREYLSYVESLIQSNEDPLFNINIFESELLNSRGAFIFGKERIISIYMQFLSETDSLEIGKRVKKEINRFIANSVGGRVKDFAFKNAALEEHRFFQLFSDSEMVLVAFTAKWCGACIKQLPFLRNIEEQYRGKLKILFISLDRSISDWKESLNMNYPGIVTLNMIPYNESMDLREMFLVDFIPQLYLVSRDFKILYDNVSPYDESGERLIEVLSGL